MKDITAIWGDDPTAAHLVAEWGEEVFRASELHHLAIDDANRRQKRAAELGKHARPVKAAKGRK